MNLTSIKEFTIPEGKVTKIYNSAGSLLWNRKINGYLTFSAPETFTLSVPTPGWDNLMEYSLDTNTWYEWDGSELSGTEIYVRGTTNTIVTGDSITYGWRLTGSDITCSGNIESLLDWQPVMDGVHPPMADFCFGYMFYYDEGLIAAPDLKATTLATRCYERMFDHCTGLTKAPKLPATAAAYRCYYGMFTNCSSLLTAPALPATELDMYCYARMFYNCTSLNTLPILPATTLKTYCYQGMFYNCSSLKLSTELTDEYTQEYCIPYGGGGTTSPNALSYTFGGTGGTFAGSPTINTTYYLHKDCSIVGLD